MPPRSTHDAHRSLTAQDDLAQILTWQETRALSKNLTLQFRKVVYQIQTKRPSYALRHAVVTVRLDAQGAVTIDYKGRLLDYTIFHKQVQQAEVVQTKQVDQALRGKRKNSKPAPDHPWRQSNAILLSESRAVPPRGDSSTLDFG